MPNIVTELNKLYSGNNNNSEQVVEHRKKQIIIENVVAMILNKQATQSNNTKPVISLEVSGQNLLSTMAITIGREGNRISLHIRE
jgi:hypothetical protein